MRCSKDLSVVQFLRFANPSPRQNQNCSSESSCRLEDIKKTPRSKIQRESNLSHCQESATAEFIKLPSFTFQTNSNQTQLATTMMSKVSALVVLLGCTATQAFAPHQHRPQSSPSSTQKGAMEEVASAIQQSSDMLYHASVVGPFSGILEGHHPAQFDPDGGIMMTEHLEHHELKPGKGFIPPSPMKDAAAGAVALMPSAAVLQEKERGRPLPVCYMD